jgi:hypothetical protein
MSGMVQREWLWPLCAVIGYAILMAVNGVRHCLLDGMRALRRYHRLWIIPAGLGVCYALFHAGLTLFFYKVLPIEQKPAFGWQIAWSPPARMDDVGGAGLDGIEALAGLFNNIVTTFPCSAIAALMLIFNWEDHHRTLSKALRKRFGGLAWLVHAGILLCALSAIIDPALFGPSLIYLNRVAPGLLLVRWAALIDWLSSLFAYLFGAGVQVYLILVVYMWLRGMTWNPVDLMDVAIRRFSIVVKWAAMVMGLSSVLIDLPRVCSLLFFFNDPGVLDRTLTYTDRIARPLLALFLIFFCTMQVTLTFHSETVARAMAHHWQFLRRFGLQLFWFLLIAAVHLFGLALLNHWLLLGFGESGFAGLETTIAGVIWSFIYPVLAALVAAWLLSSWVSLYKRCETGRLEAPDWIRF